MCMKCSEFSLTKWQWHWTNNRTNKILMFSRTAQWTLLLQSCGLLETAYVSCVCHLCSGLSLETDIIMQTSCPNHKSNTIFLGPMLSLTFWISNKEFTKCLSRVHLVNLMKSKKWHILKYSITILTSYFKNNTLPKYVSSIEWHNFSLCLKHIS